MKVRHLTATHNRWTRSKEIMQQRMWAREPKQTASEINAAFLRQYIAQQQFIACPPYTETAQ